MRLEERTDFSNRLNLIISYFSRFSLMAIIKKYLKSKPVCKVTFKMSEEAVQFSTTAYLVGDFNGWNSHATPMKKLKNGTFTVTVDLEKDREYQYRYLLDRKTWENDWEADKYVPAPLGDWDNSVVIV